MPIGSRSSQVVTISGTSAKFTNAMTPGVQFMFTANTDCWVTVALTGGAAVAAAADNILYLKGQQLPLTSPDDGSTTTNSFVHVIQASAGGSGCLRAVEGI